MGDIKLCLFLLLIAFFSKVYSVRIHQMILEGYEGSEEAKDVGYAANTDVADHHVDLLTDEKKFGQGLGDEIAEQVQYSEDKKSNSLSDAEKPESEINETEKVETVPAPTQKHIVIPIKLPSQYRYPLNGAGSPSITINNDNGDKCYQGSTPSHESKDSETYQPNLQNIVNSLVERAKSVNVPVPKISDHMTQNELKNFLEVLEKSISEKLKQDNQIPKFREVEDDDADDDTDDDTDANSEKALNDAMKIESEAELREDEIQNKKDFLDEEIENETKEEVAAVTEPVKLSKEEAKTVLLEQSIALENIINQVISANTGIGDYLGTNFRTNLVRKLKKEMKNKTKENPETNS